MKFISWIFALSILFAAQNIVYAAAISAKQQLSENGTIARLQAKAAAHKKGKLAKADKKLLKSELKSHYAAQGVPVWLVALIIIFTVILITSAITASIVVRRRRARRANRRNNRPAPRHHHHHHHHQRPRVVIVR